MAAPANTDTWGMANTPRYRESALGFIGATRHTWRITRHLKLITIPLALSLLPLVWLAVAALFIVVNCCGMGWAFLAYRGARRATVEARLAEASARQP
jgi:hypothetical protein